MPPEAAPGVVRTITLATADDTRALGAGLGRLLRAGDLLVMTGDLGAGKTTLTRGVGEGLGVRGPVTSPTFVIARVHPTEVGGPALVHVDAYRLGGRLELDDLDLDASLEQSVTVVEWGHGVAEPLSDDRIEVVLQVHAAHSTHDPLDSADAGDDESRTASITTVGARWATPSAVAALDALVLRPGSPG
ncbi:tRNA (adenosine(37)-N6)-threonylcarbamoyltransferase complex ATPase subunit type 1 TsaE [Lapillicoccus sp.]|uniref:tRNA (adenosine(37)-N6)-threonylcarbamoyltransferase complex ATPase subunit type 1 TsaE n=1 Tax=Lapillicoccus sp. TaxID=1909287 RepID=UPI0039831DC7